MSLNTTPSAERTHIGIFGRRNAGKSSLINALTGQSLAIVSDVKGTTTDPVLKAMELLPLGPVVMIDTPGIDDEGNLGSMRVQKAFQILNKTDLALLVIDSLSGPSHEDAVTLAHIQKKEIPFLVVLNKSDQIEDLDHAVQKAADFLQISKEKLMTASASSGYHIQELKEAIALLAPKEDDSRHIVADLVEPLQFVILVVPIDKAAPKGRLILPQQQTIRDLLEAGAVPIVVRESELAETLPRLNQKPALVITDSQVFAEVAAIVPREIPLTSFSSLFRLKCAEDAQIPMTNYGTAIAYMKGILPRSLEIFT